jgi:hypothetical protein
VMHRPVDLLPTLVSLVSDVTPGDLSRLKPIAKGGIFAAGSRQLANELPALLAK